MKLAVRDLQILQFIVDREAVPVDVLASAFFQVNPSTGAPNKDPLHACRRRLSELEADGWIVRHADAQRFVTIGSAGARRLACEKGKTPALKNADHHVGTVKAVEEVLRAASLGGRGRVRMENAIRKTRVGSRFVKRGDDIDVLPDAEIVVDEAGRQRVFAVEFISAKYSDAQIQKKAEGLQTYDCVFFFADKPSTAARVMRLTNVGCQCI